VLKVPGHHGGLYRLQMRNLRSRRRGCQKRWGRLVKASRLSSRRLLMAEMAEAEKASPHTSSVIDLAGRDALHVHLGQRRRQGLFGALVAFEQLGREQSIAILRHSKLELAHPGDEGAGVIAGAVAEPSGPPIAFFGAKRVGHLGFLHLLHHRANNLAQAVGSSKIAR
jgi:hypothetical protein